MVAAAGGAGCGSAGGGGDSGEGVAVAAAGGDGEGVTSIWCLVKSSSHSELLVKEVAAYALSLLRPGRDVAVLPSDAATSEFAEWCRETLGLSEHQLVIVPRAQACHMSASDLGPDTAAAIKAFLSSQQVQQPAGCQLIAYSATPALQQWMAEQQLVMPLLLDDVRGGHKGLMHRHIKHLDRPSKIEALNPSIAVPPGYTCSTVDDLLVAFRLLGTHEAVVKPLYGKEGEGVLFVSSPEELRLYGFPLGDVVLESALSLDRGADGIPISISHLTLGQQLVGSYEKVSIGTSKFGFRSTQVGSAFEATALAWTHELSKMLAPCGPGYFHYVSHRGQPVLLGLRLGQLSTEHFAMLFLQRHAPGAAFQSWTTSAVNLGVWTFWSRLLEHGCAFTPAAVRSSGGSGAGSSEAPSGVWPLLFLRGGAITLLALGRDRDQVVQLRKLAEACLRKSERPQLQLVSWREDVRRIWASGPRPEYRRQTQRFNLPNRCIPLVRKGLDVIILPGGHDGTRDFAAFCQDVLELGDEQIIITSGRTYNLDDDVDDVVLSKLKALLVANPGEKFTLVPYAVTPNFQRWARELSEFGVSVFGESLEWIQEYGHKGILHRSIAAPHEPSVIEGISPKIPVARGWYADTREQLLQAYAALGIKEVVVKPVFGAAGEGILFVQDADELALYDFPMGGVCLEERLQLDRAHDGIIISPAVHYMEGQLVGSRLVDQLMVGTGYSGWRPSVVSKAFAHTAINITQDILSVMQPRGPGGFDFLSVDGKPVLTDVNTGRFNGAHSPKIFCQLYAPEQSFYVWKQKPPERITVLQFWQRLQEAGLAFWPHNPGCKRGVFPMTFLPGLSGQYIAIADSEAEAQALRPLAEQCLAVPVRKRPPAIPQRYSLFKRADIVRKTDLRRIWCLSPLNSRFASQAAALTPLHAVALLRPGLDVVVLPAQRGVRQFYNFVAATTGLVDGQVIWTSGQTNCLHTDMDAAVVEELILLTRPTAAASGSSSSAAAAAGDTSGTVQGGSRPPSRSNSWLLPPSLGGNDSASSCGVHAGNGGPLPANGSNNMCSGNSQALQAAAAAAGSNGSGWTIIPDTPSPSFLEWAGPLVDGGVRLFGDDPGWMAKFGHNALMHKHVSAVLAVDASSEAANVTATATCSQVSDSSSRASASLDEILTDLRELVRIPRGYICSTTQDLERAYELLGCCCITLKPVSTVSPGEGVLRCTSKQELCFYDFPLGDVLLEEEMLLDRAPDGMPLLSRLPFLAGERVGNSVVDTLMVGHMVAGWRPSCLPDEVQQQLAAVSAIILSRLSPKGAGALAFGLSQGRLVLLGAQMGTFVPEHFVKMFVERWADDATYYCWLQVPPQSLDVWSFWARLEQLGAAFKPGSSSAGVYPLTYVPGSMGSFIAIAPDEPDLQGLRAAAHQALADTSPPGASAPLQQPVARWQASERRAFVMGPAREHRQLLLRYLLPTRSLALLRKGLDVAVLPGNNAPVAEFAAWACGQLGLQPKQVLFTEGRSYVLDEDMAADDACVVSQLKALVVTSGGPWALVPAAGGPGPSWDSWAAGFAELGVRLLGGGACSRRCSKTMLHRHAAAPDVPAFIEQVNSQVQVPRSYICESPSELLAAHHLLAPIGQPLLLKPLSGGGEGEGLLAVTDVEQLQLCDLSAGPVVLQELLVLDRAPDGMVLSLAVAFVDGVVCDDLYDEIIVNHAAVGLRPSEAPKRFKQRAVSMAQELVLAMGPDATMGTLFFVGVAGQPVLLSCECGVGSLHAVRLFVQQHAPPGSCFLSWRFKPPPALTVSHFWELLRSKGLVFEPSSSKAKGVFPLCFLRGLEAQLVAIGGSALDCCLLQDKARRAIDNAFQRRPPKAAGIGGGAAGASPPPLPPLDGVALQLPALGLGPPALAAAAGPEGASPSGSSDAAGWPAHSAAFGGPSSASWRQQQQQQQQQQEQQQLDLTLLVGAEAIYTPQLLEDARHVLIAAGKVVGLLDDAAAAKLQCLPGVTVQDCSGCIITPGFVDCHVHIIGGGGEAGPASRCPPAQLSAFMDAGVTCVVGLLGTDDISRRNEELVIKARALNDEGMTAFTWIGSYHAPPATVTGSVRGDMCLVESAIGVGEVAIADHRGSQVSAAELARIAAEARVGGMLSGKAGLLHVHVGAGASGLQVLRDAVAASDIPVSQFHPTHMDRSEELISQGAAWLTDGGSLDFTVRTIRARRALQQYHTAGVPLRNVTVSSDAFGSLPSYDAAGRLVRYSVADARALLRFLRAMYFQDHWPLERILPLMTSNPARLLKLRGKGVVAVGADADLLVLRHSTLKLEYVFARGVLRKTPQWTQGGAFEKGSRIRPRTPWEQQRAATAVAAGDCCDA